MSQTLTMRDGDGNVIQEITMTARLYESWWAVVRMAPAMRSHGRAVLLHLGICFVITFAVWYMKLNAKEPATPAAKGAETLPDNNESSPRADE